MAPQEIFASLTEYLRQVCLFTLCQIALVFGPAVVFGFLTQFLSEKIRTDGYARIGRFYIYFTAPGVVLHEFGHFIFAKIFGHKIVDVCWFGPQDGTLGYVSHTWDRDDKLQKIGNLFVGTGPIWVGTLAIVLLSFIVIGPEGMDSLGISSPREQAFSGWKEFAEYAADVVRAGTGLFFGAFSIRTLKDPLTLVSLYLIFCIGAHMRLSRPDVEHCGVPAMMLLGVIFLFNLCTAWLGDFSMRCLYRLTQYNHVVYALLIFVLMMLCLVWLLTIVLGFFMKKNGK